MAEGKHLQLMPSELLRERPEYQEFGRERLAKRIDQKREAAKPYGANPMQAAAKRAAKESKKVRNRPDISRKDNQGVTPYNNAD